MLRPFCIALVAGLLPAVATTAAIGGDLTPAPQTTQSPYLQHTQQQVHLQSLAAKFCLIHAGWAQGGDHISMLAALASYTSIPQRNGVRNIIQVRFSDADDRWPHPRSDAGLPWPYLEQAFSAAAVGATLVDTDPGFVAELADILARYEAQLDRRFYSRYGGAANDITMRHDVLVQLYSAQILSSQIMARDLCATAARYDRAVHVLRLGRQSAQFERVMEAVLNGSEQHGILAAPSNRIHRELKNAANAWARVRELSKQARAGQDIEPEDVLRFARAMDTVRGHMGMARTFLLGGDAGTF